jgi:transposase InsO family protein
VHTVVDDHSRVAYAEIHDAATAALRFEKGCVLVRRPRRHHRASPFRRRISVQIEPLGDTCRELNIKAKKTQPYRLQTNGKIERFHRTLADGRAFKRFYATESVRRNASLHGCTTTITVSLDHGWSGTG